MKESFLTRWKRRQFIVSVAAMFGAGRQLFGDLVKPTHKVSLRDAHKGTLEIDTQLLDSFGPPPSNLRQFYLDARAHFAANKDADYSDAEVVKAAAEHQVPLMSGPMLGDLASDGVTLWMRPATTEEIEVSVSQQVVRAKPTSAGKAVRVRIANLKPATRHSYAVKIAGTEVSAGQFTTAPAADTKTDFRIAFGSCCHKIGVHNTNLFQKVVQRQPHAMMLLGDIAVDDRNNEINMHRADYQLRDVSNAWRHLASNVPLYASWDDHDYFDNDLSGIPRRYSKKDREGVRNVYRENWSNPEANDNREGIYFSSRVGPVEIIMLDTRSCRDGKRRNEYGSYLGESQQEWLKTTLKESTAPFKIISSGTMWSDYVSRAKDSWGSWDKQAREEIFAFVEQEKIGGVLLVSGDRHGARSFRIPRPSGFEFHEFEPATLGGVSGPAGIVKDCPEQIFGYDGGDFVAFGEFSFDMRATDPTATFRLIRETGETIEEHPFPLSKLTP